MKHAVKHIHFVGIGGVGMSGIAEVLLNLGYAVSGSDLADSAATRRLANLGARLHRGQTAENIAGADVVVVSTAVDRRQPGSRLRARERRFPIVPRALMLAELMRLKQGIAIAGTHGKTTTTSLVASILGEAGMDPTYVIGGRLTAAGANARLGQGDFLVAEADESDASFLYLQPVIAVVTNIDADHMETYGHDFERLKQAFVDFLPEPALLWHGGAVRRRPARARNPAVRHQADHHLRLRRSMRRCAPRRPRFDGPRMRFGVMREGIADLDVVLNLPGMHNVLNALAAIAVATEVDVSDAAIVKALAEFHGVGRRFQRYGESVCQDGGIFTPDRRLRPSPGGNGGDARRRARRLPGTPAGAGVPAAPLYPHARLLRGLRESAVDSRHAGAGRGVSRRAKRRSSRPTAARSRARCAWPGKRRAGVRRDDRRRARGGARTGAGRRCGAGDGRRLDRRRAGQESSRQRPHERDEHDRARTNSPPLTLRAADACSRNEPMAKHVTWRAGGAAQRAYIPADLADLGLLVRSVPARADVHCGAGQQFAGARRRLSPAPCVLMHETARADHLPALDERYAGVCRGGRRAPKLARFAATHGLEGGEFLAGIPGTVGGALAMNAGCYGAKPGTTSFRCRRWIAQGRLHVRGRPANM